MIPNPEIDAYILAASPEVQDKLIEMRRILQNCLPEAQEVLSYGMPAYKQHKVLVYFAPAKRHIGYYPTNSGIEAFAHRFEESGLKYSKGAVQFPLDRPLPEKLIVEIAHFRQREDAENAKKPKK